jgi:ABC-type arginine transport system permease subunit
MPHRLDARLRRLRRGVMRHYFKLAVAIPGLASGMLASAATTSLVALAGLTHARASAYRSTLVAAKPLPEIAITAQFHLLATSLAAEEPIGILDRWSRPADFWI